MIELRYVDEDIVVCIKPQGVLSTNEPGGLPELLRQQLGGEVFTVHRLDRVVGGLMLLARSSECASLLSRQLMQRSFGKEYLAVLHGSPEHDCGTLTDLLIRDKRECKTYIANAPAKGVQEAVLDYSVLCRKAELSLVDISLKTGRTHQIRAQFSSRGCPLAGDRKYGAADDDCPTALWSKRLAFNHPRSGESMEFTATPPLIYPWTEFKDEIAAL